MEITLSEYYAYASIFLSLLAVMCWIGLAIFLRKDGWHMIFLLSIPTILMLGNAAFMTAKLMGYITVTFG